MPDPSEVELVRLSSADAALFRSLDRSEVVDGRYRSIEGGLLLQDHSEIIDGWPPGLLDKYLPKWTAAAAAGCPLIGARLGGKVIGLALVNPQHRGTMAQLMSLYVDRSARRLGAAARLCRSTFELSSAAGATAIYVSSSPTRGTVGFYWAVGFRPAAPDELDPDLHALEPNDIHMIRKL